MPGRPTIWITVGQGPTALAVGAGGGCLDIFTLIYPFFSLSPSLWETARYRLKYCHKGPLNPKSTHQPKSLCAGNIARNIKLLNSAKRPSLKHRNNIMLGRGMGVVSQNRCLNKHDPNTRAQRFHKSSIKCAWPERFNHGSQYSPTCSPFHVKK